jgi:tetratricopeptide (TPR) repeat protein
MRLFIWVLFIGTLATGCASISKPSPKTFGNLGKEELTQLWLQEGRELLQKGDLAAALEKNKLVLTINPQNREAIEKTRWLETKVAKVAEKHYRAGLKAKKRGQYAKARRQFLMALRLKPSHEKAKKMLTTHARVEAKQYVVHTLQSGESLSTVAKTYYGDYKKFPLIAAYNELEDASKLTVGKKIKVPKIDGTPFLISTHAVKAEEKNQEVAYTDPSEAISDDEAFLALATSESQEEPVDPVALYRDQGISLFEQKQYEEAIFELKKVLNVDPKDTEARKFLHKSHFNRALSLLAKEDYLSAKKEFGISAKYTSRCEECKQYARQCDESYKDLHYNQGISYFGKEKLQEAIQEWELVQAVDPNYKAVQKNLQKAGLLLKRLEEIKKGRDE